MKVAVTGRHTEVTAGLRGFAVKKVSKLEEYFDNIKEVHVILSVEKYRHTAEIFLQFAGRDLTARKTTKDMYASIEAAVDALGQQASKLKDKLHSQSNRRKSTNPRTIRGTGATGGKKPAAKKAPARS
jgi:putative sigma-54 modulation protein